MLRVARESRGEGVKGYGPLRKDLHRAVYFARLRMLLRIFLEMYGVLSEEWYEYLVSRFV